MLCCTMCCVLRCDVLCCGYLAGQAEHSLELHTPYIVRTMAGRPFTLVPIMVGALSTER